MVLMGTEKWKCDFTQLCRYKLKVLLSANWLLLNVIPSKSIIIVVHLFHYCTIRMCLGDVYSIILAGKWQKLPDCHLFHDSNAMFDLWMG